MADLDFYFDYISPNAYIAWAELPKLMAKHKLKVNPIPVLFTGLLRAHGQMGPAEQPAKRRWMSKNIARKAALLELPLAPPKHHPFNPLMVLRLSSVTLDPETRWQLIDHLMTAIWCHGVHGSDEAALANYLSENGFAAAELMQEANSARVKQALQAQTQSAIELGVFGIPSMVYQDELFFGYDDFPLLDLVLAGQDPINDSPAAQAWLDTSITPSSHRKEFSKV